MTSCILNAELERITVIVTFNIILFTVIALIIFGIVVITKKHKNKISNAANQNIQAPPTNKKHGFLTAMGVIFIILLISGSLIFASRCLIKKIAKENGIDVNTDGNPILLNRNATMNDLELNESVSATILNLKVSYILIPKVDIENLELTFKLYDEDEKLITTKTKYVGNVIEALEYIVSLDLTFSEFASTSKYSCMVTGGTVSYFA